MEAKYMEELIGRIRQLCEAFSTCSVDIERRGERDKVKDELRGLCLQARKTMNIAYPQLLMALMDAYEVTGDEGMLQGVLDVVSRNTGRLEASPEHVRLLAYCYYYVEDEECARLGREMIRTLEGKEEEGGEMEDALETFRELVGEAGF